MMPFRVRFFVNFRAFGLYLLSLYGRKELPNISDVTKIYIYNDINDQ